jgi:hypothetical protein
MPNDANTTSTSDPDHSNANSIDIISELSQSSLMRSRNSLAPLYDELTELNHTSLHILLNLIRLYSFNIDVLAQLCAKTNTILQNRVISTCEEASYLLLNVYNSLFLFKNEHCYAFLIPILKCIVNKCYVLLKMNFQVPNIPLANFTPTFYEDFKDYCKTDEWRIFIEKQVCLVLLIYSLILVNISAILFI